MSGAMLTIGSLSLYRSALVIALGKPTEKVYITEVKDGDIKYFRDENDNHAVPKYSLDELII